MNRSTTQLNLFICEHCRAVLAQIAPGAIIYRTYLKCPHCAMPRTLYPDSKPEQPMVLLPVAQR